MTTTDQETSLPFSALTPDGVSEFAKLLANSSAMPDAETRSRIRHLASDSSCVKVLDDDARVTLFQEFETRGDVAAAASQLPIEELGAAAYEAAGAFSWLAMVWLPSICAIKNGSLKALEQAKYLASRESGSFYRHLVAGPHWIRRRHGDRARLFESQPAYQHPDVVEQVASRPWLIESDGVVELLDQLYWDVDAGAPKRGLTSTERFDEPPPGRGKSSPRPGTLRALDLVLGQIECSYDVRSMTADQIRKMLPPEFDAWLA
jgi:hypothetical protein